MEGMYLGCRPDALLNPLSPIRVCLVNHFQCANICKQALVVVLTRPHFLIIKEKLT